MAIILDRFQNMSKEEPKIQTGQPNSQSKNERMELVCVTEEEPAIEEEIVVEVKPIIEDSLIEKEETRIENISENYPVSKEIERKSSFSGRKSSLRRQKCIDEDFSEEMLLSSSRTDDNISIWGTSDVTEPQVFEPQDAAEIAESAEVVEVAESLEAAEFLEAAEAVEAAVAVEVVALNDQLASSPLLVHPFLPTVYVTPPPSTIFEKSVLGDLEEPVSSTFRSNLPDEVYFFAQKCLYFLMLTVNYLNYFQLGDPVFSVLQLALEVYRARLDISPTLAGPNRASPLESNTCDWNHNSLKEETGQLSSIRQDIRDELARTERLLQSLHQRVISADRPLSQQDLKAIRSVLGDVIIY